MHFGPDSASGAVFFTDDRGTLSIASVTIISEENFLKGISLSPASRKAATE